MWPGQMCAMVYSAVASIAIAVFYYIMRPKPEAEFVPWWKRGGRYVIVLSMGLTATAAISAMVIFGVFVTQQWGTVNTSAYCEMAAVGFFPNSRFWVGGVLGLGSAGLAMLISILLML